MRELFLELLRVLRCVLLTLFLFPAGGYCEDDITELYDSAIKFFSVQKYSDAIRCWQKILDIDSRQMPPKKMIEFTRQKIQGEITPRIKAFEGSLRAGRWTSAVETAKKILDIDPASSGIKEKKQKLGNVVKIMKAADSSEQVSKLLRISVIFYLKDNPSAALDAVIYADQINENRKISEEVYALRQYFEKIFSSERSRIKLISGMTLVPQLLQSALDSIYKADYTGAIMFCDRVLTLEPDNTSALERKGSAYYALKKYAEARTNWEKVIKIDPKNKTVTPFLKRLNRIETNAKRKK